MAFLVDCVFVILFLMKLGCSQFCVCFCTCFCTLTYWMSGKRLDCILTIHSRFESFSMSQCVCSSCIYRVRQASACAQWCEQLEQQDHLWFHMLRRNDHDFEGRSVCRRRKMLASNQSGGKKSGIVELSAYLCLSPALRVYVLAHFVPKL